jgi:hypothetical protein
MMRIFEKFCELGFKDEDEPSSLLLRIFGFDSVFEEREIVKVFLRFFGECAE